MIHFYFSMRKGACAILMHFAINHGRAANSSHIYQSIMFHLLLRLPTIAKNLVILTFSSVITEVTNSWKPPDRLEAQIPAGVQILEMGQFLPSPSWRMLLSESYVNLLSTFWRFHMDGELLPFFIVQKKTSSLMSQVKLRYISIKYSGKVQIHLLGPIYKGFTVLLIALISLRFFYT